MNNFNLEVNSRTDDDFFNSLKENTTKLGQLFTDDLSISSNNTSNNNNSNNNNNNTSKHSSYSFEFQREKVNILPQLPLDNDTYWHSGLESIWNTVIAKVVIAFRNNQALGKIGLGLLMNRDKECMLVVYRSKANILSSILLHRNGKELYKQNKYWQFYDENVDCWSLYFCNDSDEKEFTEVLNSIGYQLSMPVSVILPDDDDEVHTAVQIPKFNAQTKTPKLVFTYLNGLNNTVDNAAAASATANSKATVMGRTVKFGQALPQASSAAPRAQLLNCSAEVEDANTLLTAQSESVIVSVGSKSSILEKRATHILNESQHTLHNNNLETQCMQLFMNEQRTLGTELRFNVNRIEQKVEMLLDHLNVMQKYLPQSDTLQRDDEIIQLEEKLLLLKKENRHLKQVIDEKPSQNNDVEFYTEVILSEYEEQLQRLNIEKNYDLKIVLNALIELVDQLQDEIKEKSDKLEDLTNDNDKTKNELETVKRNLDENQSLVKSLHEQENELKRRLNDSKLLNDSLKKEFEEEKKQLTNKLLNEGQAISNTVKSIMNELYLEIATKLHAQSDLSNSNRILSIIGRTIREQTLKTLPAI